MWEQLVAFLSSEWKSERNWICVRPWEPREPHLTAQNGAAITSKSPHPWVLQAPSQALCNVHLLAAKRDKGNLPHAGVLGVRAWARFLSMLSMQMSSRAALSSENWTPRAQTGALESTMIQRNCVRRENVMFFMLSSSCLVLFLWEENAFSVGAELTWNHLMVLREKWHLCREETLPALTAAVQGETKALWTWWCARSCSAKPEQSAQKVEEPCGPGLAVLSHLKLLKHSKAAPAAPQGSAKGANSDSGFEWQSEWLIQLRVQAASPPAEYGFPNPSRGWFKTLPH